MNIQIHAELYPIRTLSPCLILSIDNSLKKELPYFTRTFEVELTLELLAQIAHRHVLLKPDITCEVEIYIPHLNCLWVRGNIPREEFFPELCNKLKASGWTDEIVPREKINKGAVGEFISISY